MSTRHLLIEIGTEELPPRALKKLSEAFGRGITEGLKNADLSHGEVCLYASPRRLAVLVRDLIDAQADKTKSLPGNQRNQCSRLDLLVMIDEQAGYLFFIQATT